MGIFGKINSSSSEECLLSQQITKYIKESSSIQAYCIKDLVILEADGTGVVDYCPETSIIETETNTTTKTATNG